MSSVARRITTIQALLNTGFLLGGSRRMAEKYPEEIKVSLDTDWDFYGAYTKENEQKLKKLGLKSYDDNEKNREYWDDQLAAMYSTEDRTIQVLLRKDVVLYQKVFEAITYREFIDSVWKSAPGRNSKKFDRVFKQEVCKFFNERFKGTKK